MRPREEGKPRAGARALDWAIALALALLSLAWVMSAQRDVGLVRDELVYMHSGSRYADWWNEFHGTFVAVTLAMALTLTLSSFVIYIYRYRALIRGQ